MEDIWDSVAAEQSALPRSDEQRVEVDQRLNACESDKIKGREAEKVRQR